MNRRILPFIGGLLLQVCISLQAQSLDQAKKLYTEGQYAEAKPVFEQLVKQKPVNASYSHWYGVCCYETDDMENAEQYLMLGVKHKIQESFLYLAKVYYKMYRFDKSVEMYEDYISQLSKKKQDVEVFRAQQQLAGNARRMLEKTEDVQVIDSVVTDKKAFLNAYSLSNESGSLLPYGEFFRTDNDADPYASVVYINQKKNKIFYARPSADGNVRLFSQSRLMDKWGDEKMLPAVINKSGDDNNYPFVLSDGVTIYYASTGNQSLGGYDLFVTRYNTNSDNYLTPEQLSMPYNSIYNDYMIVFDEVKKLGWFVSDRYQPEDKVCVYLFIINEDRARLDNEDAEVKRACAMLASISATWKDTVAYPPLIALAHEVISSGEAETRKDFVFIINNTLTYYVLDDIKSPEARNYYTQRMALDKQVKELEVQLDSLRQKYTSGNSDDRSRLRPVIISTEERLATLLPKADELEKMARNAEMCHLRTAKER